MIMDSVVVSVAGAGVGYSLKAYLHRRELIKELKLATNMERENVIEESNACAHNIVLGC